jgi:hypothetical protein
MHALKLIQGGKPPLPQKAAKKMGKREERESALNHMLRSVGGKETDHFTSRQLKQHISRRQEQTTAAYPFLSEAEQRRADEWYNETSEIYFNLQ